MTDRSTDPNEPTVREEAEEDEPTYCSLCGDPITGSDVFCAGCGAQVAGRHIPAEEGSPAGEKHGHDEEG